MNLEDHALWHLELLGCWTPEDAVAPFVPSMPSQDVEFDDDWDDDELACTRCGGEGFSQVDYPVWDECNEFGWGPCNACRGTGARRHQWLF